MTHLLRLAPPLPALIFSGAQAQARGYQGSFGRVAQLPATFVLL